MNVCSKKIIFDDMRGHTHIFMLMQQHRAVERKINKTFALLRKYHYGFLKNGAMKRERGGVVGSK
jgi:hypothetical protein